MLPIIRARLERNAEYHESIVDQYKKLVELRQGQTQSLPKAPGDTFQDRPQPKQDDKVMNDYQTIMEMHRECAKQLRALLEEPLQPAIVQAQLDKTVTRDRGPVARTLMH